MKVYQKKTDAELGVAEICSLWERPGWTGSLVRASELQCVSDALDMYPEWPNWDCLRQNMFSSRTVKIWVEGHWGSKWQAGSLEEERKGDLWILWKMTISLLICVKKEDAQDEGIRRRQVIGWGTSEGNSPKVKKKNKIVWHSHFQKVWANLLWLLW